MATKNTSLGALLENRFYIGGQIPTSGTELAKRLAESLQLFSGGKPLPVNAVHATITAPPNIELLQADLSGFDVDADAQTLENAKAQVRSDNADIVDRLPAKIHKVMAKAHPLTVKQIPAEFDLQAEQVPFNWLTDKAGDVWFGLATEQPEGMHGEFTLRIEKSNLKRAVTEAVAAGAEQKGFKLQGLDFDVTQVGQDFRIVGSAKLRKGILAARADAKAVLKYDPAKMVATVTSVDLHSGNPAVAMLLRMADGQIERYRGRSVDLNRLVRRSGLTLEALEIDASAGDMRLHGKF